LAWRRARFRVESVPLVVRPEVAVQPNEDPQVEYADGDYGYDEAHDATGDPIHVAEPVRSAPPRFERAPDDSGGDYGYDEAHDMRS
jgi:hypothetical protein